jgi:cytochrome b subunit of formate dehydrogenase
LLISSIEKCNTPIFIFKIVVSFSNNFRSFLVFSIDKFTAKSDNTSLNHTNQLVYRSGRDAKSSKYYEPMCQKYTISFNFYFYLLLFVLGVI